MARRSLTPTLRARGVTAVLGPTNTGKTHLAIERMLGHESGMIGLPLRLLAREVYARVVERAGVHNVALVTGEEKIKPDRPRYWISTVEAMPRDLDLAFVAVDEIQLAADLDRGHVFTDRLLNQRGREETLLIGSATMRRLVEALIPGVHVVTRPRLSQLTFAGEKKVSRLPRRSAIVGFSAEEVYAVAELIRRQRGGAAVVLGALSPRTRNAQVELYQAGDVDYLVATDAIGMGLNLDVDHVAFAADRKYDGFRFRRLYPAEMGQIAGRAGRYMRDGTFGTTGRCPPFDAETVDALENHTFDPVQVLQWRNADLDFHAIDALRESLGEQPREHGLVRAPMGEDVAALEVLARESDIRSFARSKAAVERLWQVCQVPDYRKVSPQVHADLVGQIYRFLMQEGAVPADWFQRHIAAMDRIDGDIDTLSNRIAQVRTWTFVANRPDWLKDPEHWQGVARQVEDNLSDALHERLAQRFVDRRTSVLMRRLRENAMLEAQVDASGDVTVEEQHVGRLTGFLFMPDPGAESAEAKTLRNVAQKALAGEVEARADRFAGTPDATLVLSNDGTIRWQGDPVGKLEPGDKLFDPKIRILADEQLTGPARERVENRLKAWLKAHIVRLLGPVIQLEETSELTGLARGLGFQIGEALGVLERSRVVSEVRSLDQDGRGALRKLGVRFGAYHLYLPALLKPAPRTLAAQLWALRHGGLDQKGLAEIAHLAGSGRTSMPVDKEIAAGLYRAAGYRVSGERAVRVDILERLADLIRPAIAYRPGITPGAPPPGAADGEGFVQTTGMTSLVGCSGEDFASILRSLGYVSETRPGPAITVPLAPARSPAPAPAEAPQPVEASEAPADGAAADPAADEGGAGPEALAALEPVSSEAALAEGDVPALDVAALEPVSSEFALAEGDVPTLDAAKLSEIDEPQSHAATDVEAVPDLRAADAPPPAHAPARNGDGIGPSLEDAITSAEFEPAAMFSSDGALDAHELVGATPSVSNAPPASEPVPGASESEMASALSEAPAAEATPVEVWRLRPRNEGRLRHPRPRQGDRRAEAGRRPAGRPKGERPQEERPAGDRPQQPRRERGREERRAEGDGFENPRPPRPPQEERRGPRPEQPRTDVRRGASAPERRPFERREKAADPDSPFAKLAALKAQLEDQKGGKR